MRYFVAGVTALITVCAGCGSKTTIPSTTTTSDGQQSQAPAGSDAARLGNALVRFVNADPSGKPRELWMDKDRLVAGVAYKTITPYTEVKPKAEARFHIRETDGLDDLATTRLEFLPGWHYTLVAVPRKDGSSILLDIRDDLKQPKLGMAKVRMVNVTTDVEDLDLYVAGTKEKLQKGVDASGSSKFSEVQPGTLEIRPARRPMPPRLSNLTAEPDRLYTFIVMGKTGDVDVVSVEDRLSTEASLR